jgi:hypothetical protein
MLFGSQFITSKFISAVELCKELLCGGFFSFHIMYAASAAALLPHAVGRATVSLLLFDCLPKIKSAAGERESGER